MCGMSEPSDDVTPRSRAPRRRARAWVITVAVAGAVLLAAGARTMLEPHTFGWFAYAPLSDVQFNPPLLTVFRRAVLCVAVGAVLLGGAVGYLLGRRAIRSR